MAHDLAEGNPYPGTTGSPGPPVAPARPTVRGAAAAAERERTRIPPVPSGHRVTLDYGSGDIPILAVKLQEMFGLADTPKIAGGRVKVLLQLLSPARKPVQVTQDLKGFWTAGTSR